MLDRIGIISVFQNYTKKYNEALNDIDRKILHTFRVAKAAEQIGETASSSVKDSDEQCRDFSWFLGMGIWVRIMGGRLLLSLKEPFRLVSAYNQGFLYAEKIFICIKRT